ncbi:TraB/GumN family protein [Ruegeria sp. SCPT10]|uniref:TraB/GumN family protein n=1 Tax=Ruegeria sp. SCP10 TaxID=3141377 RepID=UPI003336BA30
MRLLALIGFMLLPATVHATCEGHDLRPLMSTAQQDRLDQSLANIPYAEGNHWIARKGDTTLHLIGTLHTNDPRMDAVVERLAPALSQADAFYFEVTQAEMKTFEQGLAQDLSPVMITSGPTLIDLMSAEDWAKLSNTLAERGIPSWMAAKMRPWFLSMMLGIPPCLMQSPDAKYGMDARLTDLAETHDIPQHSLERVEDLMTMFDDLPMQEQVESLVRMTGALQSDANHLATMANAYLEEKHAQILQLARLQGLEASGLSETEYAVEWDRFEHKMLIERNANWMEHILSIQNQTAVIAVGAGHLGDDFGLLALLEQAGYTLTPAPF